MRRRQPCRRFPTPSSLHRGSSLPLQSAFCQSYQVRFDLFEQGHKSIIIVVLESAGATPSTAEISSLADQITTGTSTKAASSRNRLISKSCLVCILINGVDVEFPSMMHVSQEYAATNGLGQDEKLTSILVKSSNKLPDLKNLIKSKYVLPPFCSKDFFLQGNETTDSNK